MRPVGVLELHLVAVWVNLTTSTHHTTVTESVPLEHKHLKTIYTDNSDAHGHCNGTLNSTTYHDKCYFCLLYIN